MSLSNASTVPGGSFANASSLGAKTVKGPIIEEENSKLHEHDILQQDSSSRIPGPFNVGTRPAALTAATKVLKEPAATAVSTISAMNRGETRAFLRTPDWKAPATARIDKVTAVVYVNILKFVLDKK